MNTEIFLSVFAALVAHQFVKPIVDRIVAALFTPTRFVGTACVVHATNDVGVRAGSSASVEEMMMQYPPEFRTEETRRILTPRN